MALCDVAGDGDADAARCRDRCGIAMVVAKMTRTFLCDGECEAAATDGGKRWATTVAVAAPTSLTAEHGADADTDASAAFDDGTLALPKAIVTLNGVCEMRCADHNVLNTE